MDIANICYQLTHYWTICGGPTIIGTSILIGSLIGISVLRAIKRKWKEKAAIGRADDIVWHATIILIFILTAQGMYTLLTRELANPLPWPLAMGTCFGVESLTFLSFVRARRHNDKHGTPGKHGRAAWTIALIGGLVVALSAGTPAEFAMRIFLPLGVAYSWWTELTQDNPEQPSTWNWTPARLLTRIGAKRPGKQTDTEAEIQRREDKYVELSFMFSSLPIRTPRQRNRRERIARRLRRETLALSPEMVIRAEARIQLAYESEGRIVSAMTRGRGSVERVEVAKTTTTKRVVATPGESPADTLSGEMVPVGVRTPRASEPPQAISAQANDLEVISENWDDLKRLLDDGALCRGAIERVCSTESRRVWRAQAIRILDLVPALAASKASMDNS